MAQTYTVLGIESSCDDTGIAIVRGAPGDTGVVLANSVAGQAELHAAFGGVVPEIAARAHVEKLDPMLDLALETAGLTLADLDAIAVTAGPGLIGGVLSGVMFAKGLAAGTGLPLVGVNHLAGHALTPRLTDGLKTPYLMLLVSGGHSQFLAVLNPHEFHRLGGTIDDAPGEAFDKTAKLMGLGYPGGPLIETHAKNGNPKRFAFPRPLLGRDGADMSFSGLKTAVRRAIDDLVEAQGGLTSGDQADLAASFQQAVVDILRAKTAVALDQFEALTGQKSTIAVAGGVAANAAIRTALQDTAQAAGFGFTAPPLKLCTDNGAMIAWAGLERFAAGMRDDLSLSARPRWPLDATATPMLGSGKKGAKA